MPLVPAAVREDVDEVFEALHLLLPRGAPYDYKTTIAVLADGLKQRALNDPTVRLPQGLSVSKVQDVIRQLKDSSPRGLLPALPCLSCQGLPDLTQNSTSRRNTHENYLAMQSELHTLLPNIYGSYSVFKDHVIANQNGYIMQF